MKLSILAAYCRGLLDGDGGFDSWDDSDISVVRFMASCEDCAQPYWPDDILREIVRGVGSVEHFFDLVGEVRDLHRPNPVPTVSDAPIGAKPNPVGYWN